MCLVSCVSLHAGGGSAVDFLYSVLEHLPVVFV